MYGRGTDGGKGLGKGGAKRHRSKFHDFCGVQGITKPTIRCLARCSGCEALTYTEHAHHKTVTTMDIVYALRRQGHTLYGFGGCHQLESSAPGISTVYLSAPTAQAGSGELALSSLSIVCQ